MIACSSFGDPDPRHSTRIMSSRYSYRPSRLQLDELPGPPFSRTVPESPARCDRKPVFFTEPDTPENQRPPSDDHVLDVEILIHKLQLHQLELEQALLRQTHRRAARERLQLKPVLPSSAPVKFHRPFNTATTCRRPELPASGSPPRARRPMDLEQNHIVKDGDIFGSLQQRSQGNVLRARRPAPLNLLGVRSVVPQTVQSATLPHARAGVSPSRGSPKQHWRRMTVSAGKNSTLIVMSSSGEAKELDFVIPPLPVTPDTFAGPPTSLRHGLQADTNVIPSHHSSATASPRHGDDAYASDRPRRVSPSLPWKDDPNMRMPTKRLDGDISAPSSPRPEGLRRKKSFFDRFDRKTKVDDVLDLYMTPEQLDEERALKARLSRPKRQGVFRMWSSNDKDGLHDTPS